MRRIIVNYEHCQQERNILLLENVELRNSIDALIKRDSVANAKFEALERKLSAEVLLMDAEKELIQDKVKQRNRIIIGQSAAILLMFLTILL